MGVLLILAIYVVAGCATAGLAARRWPKNSHWDTMEIAWGLAGLFWPIALVILGPGWWAFQKARGK